MTTKAKLSDAIRRGMALVPESRRDQGLCLNLGVGLNINLPVFDQLTNGLTIRPIAEKARADRQIRDMQIQTAQATLARNQTDIPVASLERQVVLADARVKRMTLYAPIDGRILNILVKPIIQPRQPIRDGRAAARRHA